MFVSFPFFVHAQEMLQENPILGRIMGNASVDFQAKFQMYPPPFLWVASSKSEEEGIRRTLTLPGSPV